MRRNYIYSGIYDCGTDNISMKSEEKIVKCRKPHICLNCKKKINAGQQAVYARGFLDDEPFSNYTCLKCIEEWLEESGQIRWKNEHEKWISKKRIKKFKKSGGVTMSYSSLYGIKKDYTAENICDYTDSWFFSPIVYGVLPEKYIPHEIETPYGIKKGIIGPFGNEIVRKTNEKVNVCGNTPDRICWELSMQNIFFTKDKAVISESIRKFVEQNKKYYKSDDDGIGALEREHIIERFNEIATDISELDKEKYPYFVFKNTSVNDGVERWFSKYNEETGNYEECSLNELEKFVAVFVVIKDGEIKDFIRNTDFEY